MRDVVFVERVVAELVRVVVELVRRGLEILLRREPPGRGKQIWWCFDGNDVPALHHGKRVWVPDAVGVALGLTEAAHHPFTRRVP